MGVLTLIATWWIPKLATIFHIAGGKKSDEIGDVIFWKFLMFYFHTAIHYTLWSTVTWRKTNCCQFEEWKQIFHMIVKNKSIMVSQASMDS